MSKSTPSGNTTVTQVNPTQQAQAPFLSAGWTQAQGLDQNNPITYYPGQTLANFDPSIAGGSGALEGYGATGVNLLGNSGISAQGQQDATLTENNFLNGAANSNNPTTSDFLAAGGAIPSAISSLTNIAGGGMLNSNPYLAGEFSSASQPLVNAYQTATAPQTDSNFEAAGRYGSGANTNAQSINQQNLGSTLNNLASNLYGNSFSTEEGLQNSAAGTLANTGLSGLSGAQTGYTTGNSQALQSLLMEPSIANLVPTDASNMISGGQNITNLGQAQINDQMNRYYGMMQAPYQTLSQYLGNVGQPVTGSSSTTSPYFSPSLGTQLLGGVAGLAGINSLTGGGVTSGLSSLGSLFGLGSGAGAAGTAAATTGGIGAVTADASTAGGVSSLLAALGLA